MGSAEALEQTDCLGLDNYVTLLGIQDQWAVVKLILALVAGYVAYRLWQRARSAEEQVTLGARWEQAWPSSRLWGCCSGLCPA